jgi:hypothetical protein
MREEGRLPGFALLATGLALGALADLTLRVGPWGLNACVVGAAVLAAMLTLQGRQGVRPGIASASCTTAIAAAAAGFLWRDAVVLKVLDGVVLASALVLLSGERQSRTAVRTLTGYLVRLLACALHAVYGPPAIVACDVRWHEVRFGTFLSFLLALARGLMLAAPVLLVFGVLLTSADAIFAARLAAFLDVDLAALVGHLAGTFVCAWVVAGLLRAAVRQGAEGGELPPRPGWIGLGLVELTVVLGLLDLLFAGFVWVQLRYLFGGIAWVQTTAGVSYAEYARHGFFELVGVTALVLPLLLAAHWLLAPARARTTLVFAGLAGVQVVLVLVMLASALERMRLYQQEYGLTQLRFYTTAFMLWIGVLLVWLLVTVLPGRRAAFAQGALVSAVAVVVALHAVDPEGWILATNRAHPRGLDVEYARGLGADAVPGLLAELPRLEGDLRRRVAEDLLYRYATPEAADWRRWSFPQARARELVLEVEPLLREAAALPQQASR